MWNSELKDKYKKTKQKQDQKTKIKNKDKNDFSTCFAKNGNIFEKAVIKYI
jgi:hypothetical protein